VQFIDISENAIRSIEQETRLSRRIQRLPRKVTTRKAARRKSASRKRTKSKATPRKTR
jgi:hypothetical protein